MPERGVVDDLVGAELVGQDRLAVAGVDQVDAEQEAPAADLAHDLVARQGGLQLLAQGRAALRDPSDQALTVDLVDHRETDRARQRRAVPGVTEVELAAPGRDRLVDRRAAQRRCDRSVARAEALADRDDVGLDRKSLAGEPAAGAADPADDLVEADEESASVATFRQAFPEPIRRDMAGQRGAADGLAEDRGDGLGSRRGEDLVEIVESALAGRVEAPAARRQVQVGRQVVAVRALQGGPAAQRQGAHGRPVVGLSR